ncbi:MAG: hypothetical protein JXB30_19510 [Anaerolineae bacterium]|nr:hypothetical protein [Anaerolineae bacterium]
MNWRKGVYALIGGILGFTIVMAAYSITVITATQSLAIFSRPSLAAGQIMIFCFVVPLMIIAGAALSARTLGATWLRSVAAGITALAVAVSFIYAGQSNSSPFNQYETLALACPAAVAVLVAIVGKADTKPRGPVVTIGLTVLLISCAIFTEGYGFVIALIAWLLLPVSAGLLRQPTEI